MSVFPHLARGSAGNRRAARRWALLPAVFALTVSLAAVPARVVLAQADAPAASAPPKAAKTVRLLCVGNSFSGDATRLLGKLVTAAGHTLIFRNASIGGGTMAQHWDKAQKHEKDASDDAGLYGSKRSLRQELTAEPWDYVTIQQASIRSHDVNTYRPYAGRLRDYIKGLAPKAELLLHQTWEYRSDDPRFKRPPTGPTEPATQQAMYEGLTRAYDEIAAELGARIIPVGDAFHLADTDPVWGYKADTAFDPKAAVRPQLPDQSRSLHVGWQWKKAVDSDKYTLGMDGHHASAAGQYLGACVFYEALFNESVVGNSFVPAGMDPEYARFLQQTAHKAVTARREKKQL